MTDDKRSDIQITMALARLDMAVTYEDLMEAAIWIGTPDNPTPEVQAQIDEILPQARQAVRESLTRLVANGTAEEVMDVPTATPAYQLTRKGKIRAALAEAQGLVEALD